MTSYLNPGQLLMLALLGASLHYLLARAEITRPLWSQATGRLARLLACAACSGFWLGAGLGIFGVRPYTTGVGLGDVFVSGLLGVFLVPVGEAVLLWGLERTAIDESPEPDAPASPPPTPPAA